MVKKILIIDSDAEAVSLTSGIIEEEEEMRLVGRAADGETGMSLINTFLPDIVVTELILPGTDGFELMERTLADDGPAAKPRFLVTSTIKDPQIVGQAMEFGASYYLIKPYTYAAMQLSLRRICAMNVRYVLSDPETPYRINEKVPSQQAGFLLRTIGIPLHLSGYIFLIEGLVLITRDRGCLNMITKLIYPEISRKYHTSPSRVERAMRHAIEVCWEKGNRTFINEVFGPSGLSLKRRPSNSEFLAVLSERLRAQTQPRMPK